MLQGHGFAFYLVQCLAAIVPSSAYFGAEYGGYSFAIPERLVDADRRNQVNAQTWCNGKLAEITSDDIQSAIVQYINYAMDQGFITANPVITNGKRFNSLLEWMNGVVYHSSVSVKYQEERLFTNSYGYLSSTQNGFDFSVDSPIAAKGYVCEGSAFCASGFAINGRCYKSFSDQLSWYDARSRCTARKGDLASFDFIADYSGFSALNGFEWNPPSSYWIGLRKQFWAWPVSNSDVVYSQWSSGHPVSSINQNNECLCLLPNIPTRDWKWSDCDCNQTYQFVCILWQRLSTSTQNINGSSSTTREATGSSESASATGSQYPTPSSSAGSSNGVLAVGLGVGLGVGLAVGIPIAIIILILALLIVQQRRKLKRLEMNRNIPSDETPMETKAQKAAPYESIKKDEQRGDTSTYEEISARETRQNSET